MKLMRNTFILLLMAAASFSLPGMAQKTMEENAGIVDIIPVTYSPLDSVPDWVKQKTTPEEFALWKRLSHYFHVDHTVVLLQDELSEKQRTALYDRVKETCEEAENGTYKGKLRGNISISVHPERPRLPHRWQVCEQKWIDESTTYQHLKSLIYPSETWEDEGVEFNIWFIYNLNNKTLDIIKHTLSATREDMELTSNGHIQYQRVEQELLGRFEGILKCKDTAGKPVEETFDTAFTFYPDRITPWLPEDAGDMRH